jgi:predicted esterase
MQALCCNRKPFEIKEGGSVMKGKTACLILIIFTLCEAIYQTPAFGQRPADRFLRRVHYFDQDSINYRLFVPEDYITTNRYPLILTLHGAAETGSDNERHITNYRIAETWAEDSCQQQNPAFVFSPQVPSLPISELPDYLIDTFLPTVDDILDSLIIEFPLDTSRFYITGLSMGSRLTWGYIYWYRLGRFAAAIPMSGGWYPEALPITHIQITRIPIWAFHGDNDGIVSVQSTRDMVSAIENAGIEVVYINSQLGDIGLTNEKLDSLLNIGVNHIYTEYTGADHFIWSQSYDDPILHRWLFSQKKETSPVKVTSKTTRAIPALYNLYDNYPNPFNPETTIHFQIPKSSHVVLKVYNLLGQEIRTLTEEPLASGYHKVLWDGNDNKGKLVASGLYLYMMRAGQFSQTKKMILVR